MLQNAVYHTCKNCQSPFKGKYCNNCGEKVYNEHDKSFRHIIEEVFHFVSHFDGKFLTTLKTIFLTPGLLSLDYCNGVRKKYFKPISFFLLIVILYLFFPFFQALNISLYNHVHHSAYGDYAMKKALKVVDHYKLSDEEIGALFREKSEKVSKFLLFIIIPFMAFISRMMMFRKRKYYFDHLIFTTEVSSFFIIWGFLILPLFVKLLLLFKLDRWMTDNVTLFPLVGLFFIFLYIASKRFFGLKWWSAGLYSIFFTFTMVFFIQYVYNFILFCITINLIHK